MKATLSILGLYTFDSTIFDNLKLPDGIERQDVIDNLLMELSEFEILYPSPVTMKFAIGAWSRKEFPVWKKLYDTTQVEYNILENLFRKETHTEKETRNLTGTNKETRNLNGSDNETRDLSGINNEIRDLNGNSLETRNLTGSDNETRNLTGTGNHESDTTGETKNDGKDTQKEYVSGFNETTYTPSKQTEQDLGTSNTVKGTVKSTDKSTDAGTINHATSDAGTVNHATTDKGSVNNVMTDKGTVNHSMVDTGTIDHLGTDTGTVDRTLTDDMHGSIGMITPQQMIEQERKIAKFNMIDYIIDSFKTRFCILIY